MTSESDVYHRDIILVSLFSQLAGELTREFSTSTIGMRLVKLSLSPRVRLLSTREQYYICILFYMLYLC